MSFNSRNFVKRYKWWIVIWSAFLLERIVIFATFWQASLDKGEWQNFYGQTQSAAAVFLMKFHEICDWHPPLYYFLTSVLLFFFKSQWAIYFVQIILAAVTVFLAYKIARLFFSERIALVSAFLLAIEPFWSWHNILLWSENLSIPLTLVSLYYFLKFVKSGGLKNIYLAAIFTGLDVLTRPNTLLLLTFLFFWLIVVFLFRNRLGIEKLFWFNARQILISFLIFLSAFFVVLAPWMIRNKIVYNRFTLANILSTNIYFYNLPPFIAMQKNISYGDAYCQIQNTAANNLGENVDDQGDCRKFTKEEFGQQLDFYQSYSRQYILANFFPYLKMHLIKSLAFPVQPGYFEMWSGYTGEFSKPDVTGLITKGDWRGIGEFLGAVSPKLIVYLLGIILWVFASLALLAACIYSYFQAKRENKVLRVERAGSYFKDKDKFLFFWLSLGIVVYNMLFLSPVVIARYRLPFYIFFFVPLVYVINLIYHLIRGED